MATIEKPKEKKTKKGKYTNKSNASAAQYDDKSKGNETHVTENLKIETLNEDLKDEILLAKSTNLLKIEADCPEESSIENTEDEQHQTDYRFASLDCAIASNPPIEVTSDLSTVIEDNSISNVVDIRVNEPSVYASAPPVEVVNINPINLDDIATPSINYPNLQNVQFEVEKAAEILYRKTSLKSPGFSLSESELIPFTAEQFKEFYNCIDIDYVKQFESEYLTNTLLESYDDDPFYNILLEYYNTQSKVAMNRHDIKNCQQENKMKEESIWEDKEVSNTYTGYCMDQNLVKATITDVVKELNQFNLENTAETLDRLLQLLFHHFVVNRFVGATCKVKIDQMIKKVLSLRCTKPLESTTKLDLQTLPNEKVLDSLKEIRRYLSICFFFMRKQSPNETFKKDLINWIGQLVSLQLLLASKEDHWFLLFNVLRCPSGIKNWAIPFIQLTLDNGSTPVSTVKPLPLMSNEMNLCISALQVLMMPIKMRNQFLKEFSQEERWIVIDSDGEDCHNSNGDCKGLKESDLIALLDQLPFERIFCSALNIEKFLNDYIIEESSVNSYRMLTAIAFFSKIIEILGEGISAYNNENYKHLSKRLGNMIRHSLHYVLDYHELFMCNNTVKDAASCERIAIELHCLIIRGCSYIYKARNLATWQVFLSIPYQNLHSQTIWQLFYFLNVGFPQDVVLAESDYEEFFSGEEFWVQFNIANADLSVEDFNYMMQTFFEMANSRNKQKDWELIKTICLIIFNIGYVNPLTRDNCFKCARDMLVNLSLTFDGVISRLLIETKARFTDLDNIIYLFKALPLNNWKAELDSFEILSNWLLNFDFKSSQNMLARLIISHLNWSFDCEKRLFLPHNIHVRMACLISEALHKHAPETIGVSSFADGIQKVSTFLDFTHSTKEHFRNWCWSMISVLRLHLLDQSTESVKKTLLNPVDVLIFIPELERMEMIFQGCKDNRPLPLYLALLITLHGHSIPLICQKGFELMKVLLNDYRYAAVLRCIELILPLFLEHPETLACSESFQQVLSTLLNADKTYMRMAADALYSNICGPVLELFDNMIHHQIRSYSDYGLKSPIDLINTWLMCLTSIPMWQTSSALYLIDKLLQLAYQFPDARQKSFEFFQNYYQDCNDWKKKVGLLKSFFVFNQSKLPALLPHYCWLSLTLLEVEYQYTDSSFWQEFLRQLSKNLENMNVENGLKKTLNICKIQQFPADMLVLYKYGNFLAEMSPTYPLFPIVCQRFFELYLSRVPLYYDEQNFQDIYGVSNKFYEFNTSLMQKIKKNLEIAVNLYTKQIRSHQNDESFSYVLLNCSTLITNCLNWLENFELNKISLADEQSTHLEKYKLKDVLAGFQAHWTEHIYLPNMRSHQISKANVWAEAVFRLRKTQHSATPLESKHTLSAFERIKKHLSSYDQRQGPPIYSQPNTFNAAEINEQTVETICSLISVIEKEANLFSMRLREMNSLNLNFLEELKKLYKLRTVDETLNVTCDILVFKKCSGPGLIKVKRQLSVEDKTIKLKIDQFHQYHEKLTAQLLHWQTDKFAQTVEHVNTIAQYILNCYAIQRDASDLIPKIGISLFYALINSMTYDVLNFEPANELFTQLLESLGVFIQDNQNLEGDKILRKALDQPRFIKILSGVFVPYKADTDCFIKLYKDLVDSYLQRRDPKILFVLFSKFDLNRWLETSKPKLNEINRLLQLILQGLESWSEPDSALIQDLFRRHLSHIFKYDFPQHYCEVLQAVLDRVSDLRIMPSVLVELLNSILEHCCCNKVQLGSSNEKMQEIFIEFSRKQNLFTFKAAVYTLDLFARHFRQDRLHHCLHGLYTKLKDYCQPLAAWFSCFGHVLVTTAICLHQNLLADQIFESLSEVYGPWIDVYVVDNIIGHTSNWIKQFTDTGTCLYPCSEKHVGDCKLMMNAFIKNLQYVLDCLPSSYKTLDNLFAWYISNYSVLNLKNHHYASVHENLPLMAWENFQPSPFCIDKFYETVQKFIPQCHAMLGHIFIRIKWESWLLTTFPNIPNQKYVISRLFVVFIKFAFEPNIHIHVTTSKIIEDSISYPWHLVEYAEMESLLKWFVQSVEPAIVLQLPTESNYVDRGVLDLIKVGCAMNSKYPTVQMATNATSKRIIYVRSIMALLKICAAKNQRLLSTKDGKASFEKAFTQLLRDMDETINILSSWKTVEETKNEAFNCLIEILIPMQTQSEETSNHLLSSLNKWVDESPPGNWLMLASLRALGQMKQFISGIYFLIEILIDKYFARSEACSEWHQPSWSQLIQILLPCLSKLELKPILYGPYFHILHLYIITRLELITSEGEKITFLQDVIQLMGTVKTGSQWEDRLCLVWGAIISRSCLILSLNENCRKPLTMMAQYLQVVSTESESWSTSLLGAVGLKNHAITNRRRVLSRCLACVIFSVLPDKSARTCQPSQEYNSALRELTYLIANKKFQDVKDLITKALSILNEDCLPDLSSVPHMICRLIDIFYQNKSFITIPEIWNFNYKLN